MTKHYIAVLSMVCLFAIPLHAQNQTPFNGERVHVFSPREASVGFEAHIQHLEAPTPGGDSYRGFLREQRKRVAEKYPERTPRKAANDRDSILNPIVEWGQRKFRVFRNGVEQAITGGIPNDNTLAISNDGILLSAINSLVYAYDTKNDTNLFEGFSIPLAQFAPPMGVGNFFYDPKLQYDPEADRFILTFLANNRPENSRVLFAFSSTNDPRDEWYSYWLPGNPLDNNRWTDFPCLATTKDEVIYTANLIVPDTSWQAGFDGSIIWQIDKHAGYNGDSILPARLWHDVRHNGKFIRNLHPVNGAEGIADEMYLLSNRNFDIENDTFFVAHLKGGLSDPNAQLEVKATVSNVPYGLAPNGRQANSDPNDPTDGLDINDSRVLGAFVESNRIQFVGNTVNPETGLAAIYHGIVDQPDQTPIVTGRIIGHESRDLGYPNIAWTGQQNRQPQAIIGFNHTSPTDFAGVSAIYFSNDFNYSEIIELKQGFDYVSRISGSYDRWGDYFGLQRKYNEPEVVYSAGFYGLGAPGAIKPSGTWFSKLRSPDTTRMIVQINPLETGAICHGVCEGNVRNGEPPFTYDWISHGGEDGRKLYDICRGDTVILKVTDQRGTVVYDTIVMPIFETDEQPLTYPNPFTDRFAVQFNMPKDGEVSIYLYSLTGQIMDEIIRRHVKSGLNEFSFRTDPLKPGNYIIRAFSDDEELFVRKVKKGAYGN